MENYDKEAPEEIREKIEYRQAIADLRAVIGTKEGRNLLRYICRELEVGLLPVLGMSGDLLFDKMGSLRAGNSIYKMIAAANPEFAGQVMATIEKERQDELVRENFI